MDHDPSISASRVAEIKAVHHHVGPKKLLFLVDLLQYIFWNTSVPCFPISPANELSGVWFLLKRAPPDTFYSSSYLSSSLHPLLSLSVCLCVWPAEIM